MIDYAYYNGVFTPYDACAIPISDRSIFFADAVYDVMIGRCGNPYQMDEHLSRLFDNATMIGFKNLPCQAVIEEAVVELIRLSGADNFVLYIQLSASEMRRKHLRTENGVNLLITVTECMIPDKLETVDAVTLPDKRYDYCNLKTTNLLPAVLSMREAFESCADLAILQKDGIVTECSAANISMIKGNQLITHPLDSSILPGISERNLVKVCASLGIPHIRREFKVCELFDADAVLITSTTKLMKVCKRINGSELCTSGMRAAERIFEKMRKDLLDKT